jgi:transcriptional regulator with XRE-family HTH domain
LNIERELGEALKKYRKRMGFSQEELAFRADLERVYISMIERGERKPTLHTIFKICKELQIKPSLFIKEIEDSIAIFQKFN